MSPASADRSRDRWRATPSAQWVAGAAVAGFAIPILVDLALHGWTRAFRYFAADSFLYLTVGRNWSSFGFPTIDQLHPTNGFHPLWQGFVALVYAVAGPLSLPEPATLVLVLLTNVVSISLAIWWLCVADARARGHALGTLALLPLGLYGLLVLGLETWFGPRGSLWAFANGMESGFSLLLYSGLVAAMTRPGFGHTRRSALYVGLALAGLLLARLDNAFLGAALVGFCALRGVLRRDAAAVRWALLAGLPLLVTLLGYLAVNQVAIGVALPVSGLAKSVTPSLAKLGRMLADCVSGTASAQWRSLQVFVPMLVAAAALFRLRGAWTNDSPAPLESVFTVTALFVFALGAYNALFVPAFDQGHWYFPISILFATHFALDWLDRAPIPGLRTRLIPTGCLVIVVVVFLTAYVPRPGIGPPIFEKFVTVQAPEVERHYAPEKPRILSYDDGIIAYGTGFPVMTARGFMLDAEAIEYYRRPDLSLLQLAYQRGFDRIAAVLYFNARMLQPDSGSELIREQLAKQYRVPNWELARFRFAVDYLSPDRTFAVLRMAPR